MDKIIKERKFSSNLVPIFVIKKLTFRKRVTVELLDSKMMKIQINQWTWWIPNYPWQIQQKTVIQVLLKSKDYVELHES